MPPLPVARLSSPGDLVASIPLLCGFVPHDSVVLLSLRGERRRLGLTVRLDLPPPALREQAAAALLARVVQDGGTAAVVAVYADAPQPDLVEVLACSPEVRVVEALHVAGDRWTSYWCTAPCCPPEGTPIGPPPSLVGAAQALDGRGVLGSREELVRALAPPAGPQPHVAAAWRERPAVDFGGLLQEVAQGGALSDATAAAAAVALHDVRVRDDLLARDPEQVLALAQVVAARVGPPHDAPVCTVLAWAAYCRGDGARAAIALDRALRADPQHSLALLLQAALDAALPPAQLRAVLR